MLAERNKAQDQAPIRRLAPSPARCGGIQAAAASTIAAAATMAVRGLGQCRARGSRRHKKSPSFDGLFAFQVE